MEQVYFLPNIGRNDLPFTTLTYKVYSCAKTISRLVVVKATATTMILRRHFGNPFYRPASLRRCYSEAWHVNSKAFRAWQRMSWLIFPWLGRYGAKHGKNFVSEMFSMNIL